jgi:thiamine pyrophosphate-dependent acetolactate synthase large subunit-like protein
VTNRPTCGEAIVRLLEAYGVETVFGIPGVHTLELYRGLVDSPIRHVLARHEQGAGFMADGYARATGRPGVCFLITGPGVTNAATAIAEAYSDSVPLLVISSVNERETLGKGWGELHELPDQRGLMAACTALSATLGAPDEFPELLARAFAVFESGRPRPVHIEVPLDLFAEPVAGDWAAREAPPKPSPDASAIEAAAALLAGARAPVMIVGGGAKEAAASLEEIADRLAAPVATSLAGMGVFPGSHPLSLGPTLPSEHTRALIAEADVVLAVGTELSANEAWGPALDVRGDLVRIDIDPGQLSGRYLPTVSIHADADAAAKGIAAALPGAPGRDRRAEAEATVRRTVAAVHDAFPPAEQRRKEVVDRLQAALPDDTLFVGDMTLLAYTAYCTLSLDEPGRFLFPKGYGTLGYALPAAVGAKLGAPERPVVVLAGDGGWLYTVQEMMTAVDEGAPVVALLWNNEALGAIRDGFLGRGIEPIATSPRNPDYIQLARAFGWQAETLLDVEAVGDAVARALASDAPTLIEVRAAGLE